MTRFATMTLIAALLAGCGNAEAEKRIADLEARLDKLDKGPGAAPQAASQEDEAAAAQLLQAVSAAMDEGDGATANAKIKELGEKYPSTRAFRASQRMQEEIAVLGKPAVGFEVEKWFQGSPADAEGKATMVVFWETWCPHCKREVPKLEALYEKYGDKGFKIVGVTKMTRGVTEPDVQAFLKDNNVKYPIAKEEGTAMSEAYAIRGIPAAVVIKDDKVVWRGHPARVNDPMIEGWLGS